jgi:hypothetical protein
VNLYDIELLLVEASKVISHRDYVIIGSLSVLAHPVTPPESMRMSIDVDLYPKNDPGRASEVATALGRRSKFMRDNGYYADAVSPRLPTLADGWEDRLVRVPFNSGVVAWFLEPNDAAVSKYVRGEARDRAWIRAGLEAGIIQMNRVEYRFWEARMDDSERKAAVKAIAEDKIWLGKR